MRTRDAGQRGGVTRLLACLALQTRSPDELVIVDAASTDGTREACEGFANDARFPVRVESAPCTRGGGRARIVALAKGDLVAFTDADCEPPALSAPARPLQPVVAAVTAAASTAAASQRLRISGPS